MARVRASGRKKIKVELRRIRSYDGVSAKPSGEHYGHSYDRDGPAAHNFDSRRISADQSCLAIIAE